MSPDLSYICPVNKIITMKRNWIGSSMIVALFALLASGCGHSQRTLEFRGICVDDPQGENGLYNPGRGFRLETAVDVLHEKDTPTEELNELSAKYVADSVSLSQSYFYLTYLIGKELSEENFRTMQAYFDELQKQGKKAVLRFAYERDFMGRSPVGPTGEQILAHLDQLKPFLEKNKDLILVVQAGMIGAWGEWHSSVQGLENSEETKAAVLEKLLSVVPENCYKIYVGKKPMSHAKKQEEINEILIQTAKQYKNVVRLKGGDPFVFGRGGEEVLALQKEKIPFALVPGVTSAVAVSELAGIPLTHRKESRSFHVFTGHTKEGAEQSFSHITKQDGTSVFLMSVANIRMIADRLMEQGQDELTPVAVISHGTMPDEKRVYGTLSDIADKVIKNKITSPAVFVVGQTAKYHFVSEDFGVLAGKKIGTTATQKLHNKLREMMEDKGAFVFPLCEMKVVCTDGAEKLLDELSQIKKYDWIVFTSQNAVHLFFAEADKKQIDRREFAKVRFAVVGSGTKKALETYGFYADYMPKQFTTEALAKGLTDVVKPGEHLLLPRALQASEELVLVLQKKSVTITEIPFYDVEGAFSGDLSMWKNMDVAAFFSASGVEAFVSRMGKDKIGEWERDRKKEHVAVAAIGEVTKKRLQAYGIDVDVVPEQCDLEHLGRALEQFYQ